MPLLLIKSLTFWANSSLCCLNIRTYRYRMIRTNIPIHGIYFNYFLLYPCTCVYIDIMSICIYVCIWIKHACISIYVFIRTYCVYIYIYIYLYTCILWCTHWQTNITMVNHHFCWVNQCFLWPFSSSLCKCVWLMGWMATMV